MKKMWLLIVFALCVVLGAAYAAERDFEKNETILVDTFDNDVMFPGTEEPLDWQVVGSKNIKEGFPKTVRANAWPRARFGQEPPNADTLQVLGISAGFSKKGDNWIELYPTKAGEVASLPLVGKVNAISIWVWGNKYNYDLDVVFKDINGLKYRVKAGSLNFLGWRNLIIPIPGNIPQGIQRFPAPAKISLEKFIISSDVKERSEEFFIYFDQVSTTSTVDVRGYDGNELADVKKASQVWGEEIAPYDYEQPIQRNSPSEGVIASESQDEAKSEENSENTETANTNEAANTDETESTEEGSTTSDQSGQKLVEMSVSKMEDAVYWRTVFPMEYGKSMLKTFKNSPEDKVALANDKEADERVLAAKVNFVKRGSTMLDILSYRPIRIEGNAKVISVWASGDSSGHDLLLMLNDIDGRSYQVPMGKLDFTGWRQLSIPVPEYIKQRNSMASDDSGLYVTGFRVKFQASAVYAKYQLYLDDIRALVDVFSVPVARSANDPYGSW